MPITLTVKNILAGALIAISLVFISGQASAQLIGQSPDAATATDFGFSAGTDFQNATSTQSGVSGLTSASGVADTLRQQNTGSSITVTGGSPNQAVDTPKTNKTPLFLFITIAAVTGLGLIVIFIRKTTKQQASQEQAFGQEVALQATAAKKPQAVPAPEPTEAEQSTPKKAKKPKKKNKKHHR